MPTPTVENYLKQLYLEEQAGAAGELVPMGRLATSMGVVPGTATTMVKALADSGLVTYEPRGGVRLTAAGRQLALHVLRRHRLVELFLVQVLQLDWAEVHAEAEELEHAISDKVLERIDKLLGHPQVDPHGDPIPSAALHVTDGGPSQTLATCEIGVEQRISRIADQSPAFLQFVNRCGLRPGTVVRVSGRDGDADAVTLVAGERASEMTLGTVAAGKLMVEIKA